MEFEFDYNEKALESADKDELIKPPTMYKSKSDVKDNNKVISR